MSEQKIHVIIDGTPVEVSEGTTILNAAAQIGIDVPHLCYLKSLMPEGSCRMCVVDVLRPDGIQEIQTACTEPCYEGYVIETQSDRVVEYRKMILKMLMTRHKTNCFNCPQNGRCPLQSYCREYEIEPDRFENPVLPRETGNPFFTFDPNLCIMCRRCQRTCTQVSGRKAITLEGRGYESKLDVPYIHINMERCESCGNCVDACPTGALSKTDSSPFRDWEVTRTRTVCPHCAVGCQMDLVVKDNVIVGAEGTDGPANRHGRLCVNGRFGSYHYVQSNDRLTDPLIRDRATGEFRKADWDEALDLVAKRFVQIRNQYGSDALAGFACPRSTNEDIYMVQKMVRCCFGTNNVDNCANVYHSASGTALEKTLGNGSMTNSIRDITTDVDAILLIGSNPEETHPVVGMQIREAVRKGARLVVINPAEIDMAAEATLWVRPKRGTNIAFANGVCHALIEEGLIDEQFIAERTENFEALKKSVEQYTPRRVAEICGVNEDDVRSAARIYAMSKRAPIIYCLPAQEYSNGSEGVIALSNLALLCGKLGKPGCGINPLRGQNNVQGVRDMGAQPNKLPGYQDLKDPRVLRKFENAWSMILPSQVGLDVTEIYSGAITGDVKGLYICGEDPMRTDPNPEYTKLALESLDFLVVQELQMTETAKLADVVLPGRAFAEKDGTFSNTERRVQRVRKAITVPGNMRSDTEIICDLMRRMGYPQPTLTPSEIFDEMASLSPLFAGMSYARLDSAENAGKGLQWPCPTADHPGTPILHKDQLSRGKGLFEPAIYTPSVTRKQN